MNRSLIIILVALLVLGAAWKLTSRGAQQSDTATTTVLAEQVPQNAPAPTKPKATAKAPVPNPTNTFKSIFSQAGSHECSYSKVTVSPSGQNNYRIFISGGKMRGEFYEVGKTGIIMVYDGSLLYSWKEGASTGTKAPLNSLAQLPVAIPSDLESGAVYGSSDTNVSWDCHPWIADKSVLTPPTYVHFSS